MDYFPGSSSHSFGVQLQKTLPYIGFLICDEAEAEVWASASDLLAPRALPAVTGALAQQPTSNPTATACCQFYPIDFTALRTSRSAGPLKDFRFGSSLPTLGIDGEIVSSVPRDEYLLTTGS